MKPNGILVSLESRGRGGGKEGPLFIATPDPWQDPHKQPGSTRLAPGFSRGFLLYPHTSWAAPCREEVSAVQRGPCCRSIIQLIGKETGGGFRPRSEFPQPESPSPHCLPVPAPAQGGLADGCLAGLLHHRFSVEPQPSLSCLPGSQAPRQ